MLSIDLRLLAVVPIVYCIYLLYFLFQGFMLLFETDIGPMIGCSILIESGFKFIAAGLLAALIIYAFRH